MHNNGLHPKERRGAQDSAQVARVGDRVEHQDQRAARAARLRHDLIEIGVGELCDTQRNALGIARIVVKGWDFFVDDRHARRGSGLTHLGLDPRIARPQEHFADPLRLVLQQSQRGVNAGN